MTLKRYRVQELDAAIRDAESRGYILLQRGSFKQVGLKLGVTTIYWARLSR